MYICLLIQTLQCEQKHIIHESLLQTFNTSQSATSLPGMTMMPLQMSFQSHVCHSIFNLAVFFLYGMVIRPPGIFLLHISGSVDY